MFNDKCPQCGEWTTFNDDKCYCQRREDRSWNKRKRIPRKVISEWIEMKNAPSIQRWKR